MSERASDQQIQPQFQLSHAGLSCQRERHGCADQCVQISDQRRAGVAALLSCTRMVALMQALEAFGGDQSVDLGGGQAGVAKQHL